MIMIPNRISRKLIKFSKRKITLVALVVFLIFSVVVLPRQSAAVDAYSADLGSPDLSLFYSPSDLYRMAEQYGSAGRDAYVRARFSFDLIFPIIYTFFLVTAISRALGTLFPEASQWQLLNLAPIVGMLLDFLENITASIVIGRYPTPSPLSANLAPVFTFLKWVFVGGSFLILFISGFSIIFTHKNKPV